MSNSIVARLLRAAMRAWRTITGGAETAEERKARVIREAEAERQARS